QGGVSMLGACLPMLVSIGMSFWVWGSVRSMSDYGNMRQYLELYDVYTQSYDKHYEENKQHYEEKENIELSTRLAQQEVLDFFKNSRDADSFLMIKNVWAADVPWSSAIPDSFSDTKYTDPNRIFELDENGNIQVDKDGNKIHMEGGEFEHMMSSYDKVTAVLRADSANSNNGYLIVVLVSSGIMMISQLVMARAQRASGMTPTLDPTENPILSSMQVNMKLMVYVMPAIMAVFMLIQPAAFAMYMGVGSATTLIISTTSTQIMKMLEKRHEKEIVNTVQKYGRPDPKDLIDTKDIEFDKEDKK
ncbi:MAG: YidC/Oxa1 family membrane protein insertase, partial [Firmicutes bacterium]|nr:YidC/Oxa1 family membrane protein insertase [Bacillota bacterium]